MDKNNGETTTTKKSTVALLLIHCHFILQYSPAPISNRSFSKLQVNYYQIRIIQKRWFLKMLGNIPLEKKKKKCTTRSHWSQMAGGGKIITIQISRWHSYSKSTANSQSQTRSYYSSRWRKSHSSALSYKQRLPQWDGITMTWQLLLTEEEKLYPYFLQTNRFSLQKWPPPHYLLLPQEKHNWI